jgi:hypothetical protein
LEESQFKSDFNLLTEPTICQALLGLLITARKTSARRHFRVQAAVSAAINSADEDAGLSGRRVESIKKQPWCKPKKQKSAQAAETKPVPQVPGPTGDAPHLVDFRERG